MITLYARTVGELREVLKDIPDDSSWFGDGDCNLYVQRYTGGYCFFCIDNSDRDED